MYSSNKWSLREKWKCEGDASGSTKSRRKVRIQILEGET